MNDQSSMSALAHARMQAVQERRAQAHANLIETVRVFEPETQPILFKPTASSWEVLEPKLAKVVNFLGVMKRARELYDQGYGAELETAAEIALARAAKRFNYFSHMIAKKYDDWETKTLPTVHATWEVRRNALKVMRELKLKAESTNPVLALAWRLRGTILRFLGIATEQGTGIENPAGVFFALTKQQLTTA